MRVWISVASALLLLSSMTGASSEPADVAPVASELIEGEIDSAIVPGPIEYYAVLPPGYEDGGELLPLVLSLHGGRGSRDMLKRQRPLLERLWANGDIPPMVVVMPSVTPRSFYMDYRDGSQKWETFLVTEFLPHLRRQFRVRDDRRGTLVTGVSMGGMGSLRLAFKYPEVFGAVASMEPGIEPILAFDEMRPKHHFWRSDALLGEVYGSPIDSPAAGQAPSGKPAAGSEGHGVEAARPVDAEHWSANNPATIATRDADKLRDSGLKIFLEAGDEDMFWLYEGTEFLHQVLWEQRIRHEYRLYYGLDHLGASLGPRTEEALRFLAGTLRDPDPEPRVEAARQYLAPLKSNLSESDHYRVDEALIGGPARSPGPPPP